MGRSDTDRGPAVGHGTEDQVLPVRPATSTKWEIRACGVTTDKERGATTARPVVELVAKGRTEPPCRLTCCIGKLLPRRSGLFQKTIPYDAADARQQRLS